jgi:uncharacterized repeat protein (TIGR01451 family)
MATPLTAGAGALVRQWLATRGSANPSAALVKAMLLNTTHDMAPGQYGGGAKQEIPAARPNSVAGWGRVDLDFMGQPAPYGLWVDDHTAGVATGQLVSYSNTITRPLEVFSSAQPLRIMLAWTDPPASLSAARQLVNDLDLKVVGPGGATYYGNNMPAGDRLNNVEGIVIDNPPIGTYSVEVRGFNVPIAAQPYALSVAGPLAQPDTPTLSKTANPSAAVAPGGLITYTLALNAGAQAITQTTGLTDTLPLHTSFVGASGGAVAGALVTWAIPPLTASQTITRTLTVRVASGTPANTTISNMDYGARVGGAAAIGGPPVHVIVQAPPPRRKVWLPLIVR